MIHHNKAINMYCVGPTECGHKIIEKTMDKVEIFITYRKCVGNECMAWKEGTEPGYGQCLFLITDS